MYKTDKINFKNLKFNPLHGTCVYTDAAAAAGDDDDVDNDDNASHPHPNLASQGAPFAVEVVSFRRDSLQPCNRTPESTARLLTLGDLFHHRHLIHNHRQRRFLRPFD